MGLSKIVFTNSSGGKLQLQNNSGGDVDLVTTGFTVNPVVRLGDASSHGGTMTTATGTPLQADGIAVCKNGDTHTCPIPGHGATPVTATTVVLKANGGFVIRTGDKAGCGAILTQGSPTLQSS